MKIQFNWAEWQSAETTGVPQAFMTIFTQLAGLLLPKVTIWDLDAMLYFY